ncbi:hypothetical protein FKP32DRAFT_1578950 [Trametes sanguinea]|nr:hypothetical protein FKP32DRAFT_1578950 [Trametes sanguinea]
MPILENGSAILLSFPIYVQLQAVDERIRNRHILITLRLIEDSPDIVHLDTTCIVINASTHASIGPPSVSAPSRRGVQLFADLDPTTRPMYILISRLNRFGERYHLAVALHIQEGASGQVNIHASFIDIRRCLTLRSRPISIRRTVPRRDSQSSHSTDNANS